MNALWLEIIGLGVLLVLLGGWLLLVPLRAVRDTSPLLAAPDPCKNLFAAWQQAKLDCEDARRAADIAHATAERREADEWAARDRASDRPVPTDVGHASLDAAQAVAAKAEARATEICGRANAAHLAYQACVKERGSTRAASRSR